MTTIIRPELSTKNKYYINKHRHYELKHFCLQHPEWKKLYSELDNYSTGVDLDTDVINRSNISSDITSRYVEKRLDCLEKMNMVE